MQKNRLEAFSDGVFAIIITIMVLELKAPHGDSFNDLIPLIPTFLSYLLSFLYLAIYWNNHHHLLQITKGVNGAILWANVNLLFWLTLIPFVTAWSGQNHFTSMPVAAYGIILFLASIAYYVLVRVIIAHEGGQSSVAKALGKDVKGRISSGIYALAIILSFFTPKISLSLYALVALIWIVPDTRIEKIKN
ncbi:MAG: TMEM175 family protein [Bacteriovoracales bacterium]